MPSEIILDNTSTLNNLNYSSIFFLIVGITVVAKLLLNKVISLITAFVLVSIILFSISYYRSYELSSNWYNAEIKHNLLTITLANEQVQSLPCKTITSIKPRSYKSGCSIVIRTNVNIFTSARIYENNCITTIKSIKDSMECTAL